MAALKLYDLEPSGNCYKIRLYCALLGLPLEVVPIDFMGGAHKKSPGHRPQPVWRDPDSRGRRCLPAR